MVQREKFVHKKMSSTSLPVTELCCGRTSQDLELKCSQVEDLFIKRNYTKALKACNQFFEAAVLQFKDSCDCGIGDLVGSSSSTIISLSNPLHILGKSYSISILTSNDGEMSSCSNLYYQRTQRRNLSSILAIALQSWYELDRLDNRLHRNHNDDDNNRKSASSPSDDDDSSANWKHLQPLLEFLHRTPIPSFEFFNVWIYFWENQGQQQQNRVNGNNTITRTKDYKLKAIDWTVQVLLQYTPNQKDNIGFFKDDGTDDDDDDVETMDSYQELWIHCITEQLPKLAFVCIDDEDDDDLSPSRVNRSSREVLLSSLVTSLVDSVLVLSSSPKMGIKNKDVAATTFLHSSSTTATKDGVVVTVEKKKDVQTLSSICKILRKGWQTCNDGSKCCEWIAMAIQILQEEEEHLQHEAEEELRKTLEASDAQTALTSLTKTSLVPPLASQQNGHFYSYFKKIRVWIQHQYQNLAKLRTSENTSSSSLSKHRRFQIGISVLGILLTVRYRSKISNVVKGLLISLLAPITELIQALGGFQHQQKEKAGTANPISPARLSSDQKTQTIA